MQEEQENELRQFYWVPEQLAEVFEDSQAPLEPQLAELHLCA